jgi:hypothetical protein
VDVKLGMLWGFIRVRDTCEVLNFSGTSLFVEALNITLFANFKW